ncbi:nucleotidyl transferase AbiEii/AbiGii toxin family protein [Asticcacaulis sp.]|uniref:nucleotidyl transferase AbiEii/AbiGii toxin family protein n=1 Tax=Asticcacaulis sp. TaxID=1872648 RepID=UPI003F7C1401
MDIRPQYQDQVKLLLDILPFVAEEPCFALKGGTAINLFEWDLPRLSVDIDLTYVPTQGRDEALATISEALGRLKVRIEDKLKPTRVTLVPQKDGLEAKLHCQRLRTQIKVEVNPVLRGHLLPVRSMACSERVQDMFGRFVETPVISRGELFGGKLCAAMDRQHPRDLFDVKHLLDLEAPLPNDIKLGMIAGLVSHGRPIAELIKPRIKDREQSFTSEFEGMSFEPFTYADHQETFERLSTAVQASLGDADRAFLLSFETGDPDWNLFPFESLQTLAGPQWKLRNLRYLRDTAHQRHADGVKTLKEVLYPAANETRAEIDAKP